MAWQQKQLNNVVNRLIAFEADVSKPRWQRVLIREERQRVHAAMQLRPGKPIGNNNLLSPEEQHDRYVVEREESERRLDETVTEALRVLDMYR